MSETGVKTIETVGHGEPSNLNKQESAAQTTNTEHVKVNTESGNECTPHHKDDHITSHPNVNAGDATENDSVSVNSNTAAKAYVIEQDVLDNIIDAGVNVSIAVQADEYEIERSGSKLPSRKRIIPVKFRDYGNIEEDYDDEDYEPDEDSDKDTSNYERSVLRKRGRPRKYIKLDKDLTGAGKVGEETIGDSGDIGADLNQHVTKTTSRGKQAFACPQCTKTFSLRGNLNVHMRIHRAERPFPCSKCEKAFRSKESLRRHNFIHDGVKPFKCGECKRSFSSNQALKEHMNLHTNEKPLKCDVCEKSFRQASCLARHLMTHQSELKHACPMCGKRFTQAAYVRSHIKSHTGERPFVCAVCSKGFAHRSDLNRHRTVHTGEKPYACDICYARFSDASSRRRHYKEHEGVKPYNCNLCQEGFKRSGQLKVHLSKKHAVWSEFSSDNNGEVQYVYAASDNTETQEALQSIETTKIGPAGSFIVQDGVAIQAQSVSTPEVTTVSNALDLLGENDAISVYHVIETVDEATGEKHTQILEIQGSIDDLPSDAVVLTEDSQIVPSVSHEVIADSNEVIAHSNEVIAGSKDVISDSKETTVDSNEAASDSNKVTIDPNKVIINSNETITDSHEVIDDSTEEITTSKEVITEAGEVMVDSNEVIADTDEVVQDSYEIADNPNEIANELGDVDGDSDVNVPVTVDEFHPESTRNPREAKTIDTTDGSSISVNFIPSEAPQSNETLILSNQLSAEECVTFQSDTSIQTTNTTTEVGNDSMDALEIVSNQETVHFIAHPDFGKQEYYNWLSNFSELCKVVPMPLDMTFFQNISQVHKTLSDELANPNGILKNKKNFETLMLISADLNGIINEHLTTVLKSLE